MRTTASTPAYTPLPLMSLVAACQPLLLGLPKAMGTAYALRDALVNLDPTDPLPAHITLGPVRAMLEEITYAVEVYHQTVGTLCTAARHEAKRQAARARAGATASADLAPAPAVSDCDLFTLMRTLHHVRQLPLPQVHALVTQLEAQPVRLADMTVGALLAQLAAAATGPDVGAVHIHAEPQGGATA